MKLEIELAGLACLMTLAAGCLSPDAGADEPDATGVEEPANESTTQEISDPATAEQASARVRNDTHDKPGFVTDVKDGRLWVFPEGSEEFETYVQLGEPAKHVTHIGAGPGGMTIKAPSGDVIDAYMVACEGFVTHLVEELIWVFRPSSEALATFLELGEPAKHVTRIGVGPGGRTVRAPDVETLDSYLAAVEN